jgi:hypothetical protein
MNGARDQWLSGLYSDSLRAFEQTSPTSVEITLPLDCNDFVTLTCQ